jgi:hypothetical protein
MKQDVRELFASQPVEYREGLRAFDDSFLDLLRDIRSSRSELEAAGETP